MPEVIEEPHLRLAGVIRLSVKGRRGPTDAFVFDPHRLALPCWAVGLEERPAATLLTLDRHFDLVEPKVPAPSRTEGLRALDEYARWSLDVRNYDHVLAAMEAGLIKDAVVIARFAPKGALRNGTWTDRHGVVHRIVGAESPAELGREAIALLESSSEVLLDVDLDCFTTPLIEDPTSVEPWSRAQIREWVRAPRYDDGRGVATAFSASTGAPLARDGGSSILKMADAHAGRSAGLQWWDAVLPKIRVLTFAREPFHCGGLVESAKLFEDAAAVLFEELFGSDLP